MATCETCGKSVIFAADEKGTNQVLDVVTPVYEWRTVRLGPGFPPRFTCERRPQGTEGGVAVSHFCTCPQATQHSKKESKTGTEKQVLK